MSRRQTRPVPKEALFLFDDGCTDIRPTKCIFNDPSEIAVGNTVSVEYGEERLNAEILFLSGNVDLLLLNYLINLLELMFRL